MLGRRFPLHVYVGGINRLAVRVGIGEVGREWAYAYFAIKHRGAVGKSWYACLWIGTLFRRAW